MKPAYARNTDPVTSHIAAKQLMENGLSEQRSEVLIALSELDNCTAAELGRSRKKLSQHICARRLPELMEMGFVMRTDIKRKCKVTKNMSFVWRFVRFPDG